MSTGFTFGAKTSAPTLTGPGTLSFGTPSATNPINFGTNIQQQQQQQPTGFQLGSTFAKPTTSVAPQTGGFGLGTTTPSVSSGFGFGAPSSTAAQPGLGSGLSFGTTTAPTLNFGLGTNTAGNTLGAAPPTTAINLSFGAPSTSATTALNFGAPAASSGGFGFGTTPLSTANTTGLSGATAGTTTSGFSLGGLTSSAAPTSALNFGTSTTGSTPAATTSTGLAFRGATTSAPSFNFNLPNSTTASGGLTFGGAVPSTGFSLNTSTVTAAPVKVGLGGIQTSTAASLGTTTAVEIPPKEQQVPNEIQQDIENFKNYVKQQKLYSSDVSRCCVKDFRCVEAQIAVLNNVIKEIESQVERNRSLAEKLKYDTAQGLQLLEMAQRTQDIPAGLQYENVAPMNFFLNLADNFEKEMHALKIQIENTDDYVKNFGQPATLTSHDLSLGMKRLHDTFVALAGRLQSVHTQVESQKELYTNLRKQLANDFNNPFEALDKKLNPNQTFSTPLKHSPPKIACGPTPFSQIMTSNFPTQPNVGPTYPGMPSAFGGSVTPSAFGNMSALGKSTLSFQSTPLGSSFQLQKPPTGNKRGKQ